MKILSITYARGLYLVPFKIPKLYKIPHSRCMLRQFETCSSARPTAAALQRARLQEKNIIVPLPLIQPELPCQRESLHRRWSQILKALGKQTKVHI